MVIKIPGNPYPMTKPKASLNWKPKQETYPYPRWEWPSGYRLWRDESREMIKDAMLNRPFFVGLVALGATFAFQRPTDHYRANGAVKDAFLMDVPQYDTKLLHELFRGVVDVCHNTVFPEVKQIAFFDRTRTVWRASGFTEITIRNIEPEEIDEDIAKLPTQGELGL